ncbi:MAG: methionine ABC transporter permease [Fusobacteriaceae bacterium]
MDNLILLGRAFGETVYMVFFSSFFSILLGAPLAVLLVVSSENNLCPNRKLNNILGILINCFRSFPFIILMILIFPLSRIIVGTSIGSTAAIVPLSISAVPFAARIIEGALKEVDKGLIDASLSMGASNIFIIRKVLIPEASPQLINGLIIIIISLIGYSAMAGAIGGGGLGDIAIRYGYLRFKTDIMIYSVLFIILLVQVIQSCGNYCINIIKRKRG